MQSVYETLSAWDVFGMLERYIASGEFVVTKDWKVVPKPMVNSVTKQDVFVGYPEGRECYLWALYFDAAKIIPKGCRGCRKVFLRTRSVADAFRLVELMQKQREETGISGKVGMEQRPYTGNRGGFRAAWYVKQEVDDFEAKNIARRIFGEVEAALEHPYGIMLKRGCTEMEMRYSPSSQWERFATASGWDVVEDLLDSVVEKPEPLVGDSTAITVNVKRRWIEHAFENGDETYLEFTGGRPLSPPPEKIDLGAGLVVL